MYPLSSQKKYWTFASMEQLNEMRVERNQKFIERWGRDMDVSFVFYEAMCNAINMFNVFNIISNYQEQQRTDFFLDSTEEHMLLKQYEIYLNDFCRRFEPMMPKCVVGTAVHYFKRFYLHNSAMDYHPKEIL